MANRSGLTHIDQVAELFDLNLPEAERQLDELAASTDSLVASGWDVEDAAVATHMAALGDFDLGYIEAFASDEGVSLVDGGGVGLPSPCPGDDPR